MILVVGGTGRMGRQLVRLLAAEHVPFRVLCRKPEQAGVVLAAGAKLVRGYLEDPVGLESALEGATRVFLLSSNGPAMADLQMNLVGLLRRAGVEQVVKLSMHGAAPRAASRIARQHWLVEQEIERCGVGWTHLRPAFFHQDFLEHAASIRAEGRIYACAGNGRVALLDVRDLARVAVAVLTGEGHAGAVYELTGPQAVSHADAARLISTVAGSRVTYRNLSEEEAVRRLRAAGLPGWLVEARLELYRIWTENEAAEPTGDVERVTGTQPTSFVQFVRDHASVFHPGRVSTRRAAR